MVLVDAALAFALTMAALATVVTILMEIALRFLGLKKKDQVRLLQRLFETEIAPKLPAEAKARLAGWDVVRKVMANPFAAKSMAETAAAQGYVFGAAKGAYEWITPEHLLRRVLELEDIKAVLARSEAELRAGLRKLGQTYDLYRSALTAEFRRRAQLWSIIVGVILALAMNVDGVRLFQAYMKDPELTQQVVVQMEPILRNAAVAEAQRQEAAGQDAQTPEQLDEAVARAKTQLALVTGLQLPIGRDYFPHCLLAAEAAPGEPLCAASATRDAGDFALWFIKAILTGVLIGLGAPFWYDVARRAAQIRQAFGGRGTAEQRHAGKDGADKTDEREDLIDRVIRDTLSPKSTQAG